MIYKVKLPDDTYVEVEATSIAAARDITYDEYGEEPLAVEAPKTRTQAEIKAEGERAYADMNKQIKSDRTAALKDAYGYLFANPVTEFVGSAVLPSSMESIRSGEEPGFVDVATDVGLAGMSLLPPLKAASTVGTVAKNAGVQGVMSGVGEGVMATSHGRPYNILAPLTGAVVGGALGGLQSRELSQIDKLVPPESVGFIEQNLGLTRAGTKENLARAVPDQISEIAIGRVSPKAVKSVGKNSITLTGSTGMEFADDVRKAVTKDVNDKLLSNQIDDAQARRSLELLNDFELGVIEYAQHNPESKVSIDNMVTLAGRMYKQDPTIGSAVIDAMEPYIGAIQRNKYRLDNMLLDAQTPSVTVPAIKTQASNIRSAKQIIDAPAPTKANLAMLLSPESAALQQLVAATPEGARRASTAIRAPVRATVAYPGAIGGETRDADGNLLYAPRGRISYEDLYKDVQKK